jgi:hypothetical protein
LLALPVVENRGWHLKRYAIIASGKAFDETIANIAAEEALIRLPKAGALDDETGNQAVAFQIVHFAEVAIGADAAKDRLVRSVTRPLSGLRQA